MSDLTYQKPKWYTQYWRERLPKLTDEDVERWRLETEEVERQNTEVHKRRYAIYQDILEKAKLLWSPDSSAMKAIKKHRPIPPSSFDFNYNVARLVKEYREQQVRDERKKQAEQELVALRERSILWLQAQGKTLGADFNLSNALEYANDLAFEQEKARLIEEREWHDFSDQNCDEPCSGWDGKSRRCECGNRRVDWVACDSHTFEDPCIYGEAY